MKIHRDDPKDDVRAAKDSPPIRGWPEKWTGANIPRMFAAMLGAWRPVHAGGVEFLNRATGPFFGPLLSSRLLRPITATSGGGSEP